MSPWDDNYGHWDCKNNLQELWKKKKKNDNCKKKIFTFAIKNDISNKKQLREEQLGQGLRL